MYPRCTRKRHDQAGKGAVVHPVAILNTSILSEFGSYTYEPLTTQQARQLVAGRFMSAVGHQATAEVLSEDLGADIPMNRITFVQEPRQRAIVLKLCSRPAEGVILTKEEVRNIGYELALLTRTA